MSPARWRRSWSIVMAPLPWLSNSGSRRPSRSVSRSLPSSIRIMTEVAVATGLVSEAMSKTVSRVMGSGSGRPPVARPRGHRRSTLAGRPARPRPGPARARWPGRSRRRSARAAPDRSPARPDRPKVNPRPPARGGRRDQHHTPDEACKPSHDSHLPKIKPVPDRREPAGNDGRRTSAATQASTAGWGPAAGGAA